MLIKSTLLAAAAAATAACAGPAQAAGVCDASTQRLQAALERLHYPAGPVDGCRGPATDAALRVFQRANGLAVDGVPGPATEWALQHPVVIAPISRASGRHVEVDLARQLLLVVDAGQTSDVYSVSTGMRGHETPTGSFRIGRKERRSWSVPYRVWMPYASYFVGGVAFHEGDTVTSRSSHGCVHVPSPFAAKLYRLLVPGMTVIVTNGARPAVNPAGPPVA
jgi:lipoprotein-anchoring transpeptidase ErfK/SrfK